MSQGPGGDPAAGGAPATPPDPDLATPAPPPGRGRASRAPSRWVLPGLVLAQACGISPWLSSSAVLPSLRVAWGLAPGDAGLLVSAVQAGFLCGTLAFALLNLADVFAPRRVFLASALVTAGANAGFALAGGLGPALVWRFVTGVALAGVYPVGMKLAVSWFPGRAGYVLGWMLAAGTLGSSSSFLLAGLGVHLPWQAVLGVASALAAGGGVLALLIGEGPHLPPAQRLELTLAFRLFRLPRYRAAALGYFGHMWEIYAAWALAPLFAGMALAPLGWGAPQWVRLGAFALVAAGIPGCLGGGAWSLRAGSLRVAAGALALSGAFCLVGPLLFLVSPLLYGAGLLVWGAMIIADSAQFFALASGSGPERYVGTALTIQTCIGFAVTVVSIELTSRLIGAMGPWVTWVLAPGPALGLWALLRGYRAGPAAGSAAETA